MILAPATTVKGCKPLVARAATKLGHPDIVERSSSTRLGGLEKTDKRTFAVHSGVLDSTSVNAFCEPLGFVVNLIFLDRFVIG